MQTIYVIRHGQTAYNAEYRLQGQADTPINEKGRGQAKRNGELLAGLLTNPGDWDYIASPLGRTRETMEIIRSGIGIDPAGYRTEDRLMEINLGDWQGYTWDELREAHPEEIEARFQDMWNTVSPGPGGESYKMVAERTVPWFEGLEKNSVVVTHGGVIRCLQGHFHNLPEQETPALKVPQDRVLKISGTTLEWL